MKQISIREQDEFIKLGQALKKADLVSSGVEAKIVIQDGQVTVNGETELPKGALVPAENFDAPSRRRCFLI